MSCIVTGNTNLCYRVVIATSSVCVLYSAGNRALNTSLVEKSISLMRDVPNRNQSLVIWELNIKPISPAAPN